jgi:hypothetical protein
VAASDPARIAALLHEAAETHHVVYRITDGEDPDWASAESPAERWEDWYAAALAERFG